MLHTYMLYVIAHIIYLYIIHMCRSILLTSSYNRPLMPHTSPSPPHPYALFTNHQRLKPTSIVHALLRFQEPRAASPCQPSRSNIPNTTKFTTGKIKITTDTTYKTRSWNKNTQEYIILPDIRIYILPSSSVRSSL